MTEPMSVSLSPAKVGILAGMGPFAGVDFAAPVLQSCERWLQSHGHAVKGPGVSRTLGGPGARGRPQPALADADAAQPLEDMARVLRQFTGLGIRAAAISCNTAHAWRAELQARVGCRAAASRARRRWSCGGVVCGVRRCWPHWGTYRVGLYDAVLAERGIVCLLPNAQEREWLMGYLRWRQSRSSGLGARALCQGGTPDSSACTGRP